MKLHATLADAIAFELDLARHPVYRANIDDFASRKLAAWGHREPIRVRGRLLRPGTVAIGSVEDWHRERYLDYRAGIRARAARQLAAMRPFALSMQQFADGCRRATRTLARFGMALGTPPAGTR
jgi:hypothetical protein